MWLSAVLRVLFAQFVHKPVAYHFGYNGSTGDDFHLFITLMMVFHGGGSDGHDRQRAETVGRPLILSSSSARWKAKLLVDTQAVDFFDPGLSNAKVRFLLESS
ncbi:MAG: hypothetical protein U0519_03030 [Candidatus Gracilibacteria bacterium]